MHQYTGSPSNDVGQDNESQFNVQTPHVSRLAFAVSGRINVQNLLLSNNCGVEDTSNHRTHTIGENVEPEKGANREPR